MFWRTGLKTAALTAATLLFAAGSASAQHHGGHPGGNHAAIHSSQEYYNNAGGSPEGFVQALFQDLSGRRPTSEEMGYWVRRVVDRNRNDVAYALLTR